MFTVLCLTVAFLAGAAVHRRRADDPQLNDLCDALHALVAIPLYWLVCLARLLKSQVHRPETARPARNGRQNVTP